MQGSCAWLSSRPSGVFPESQLVFELVQQSIGRAVWVPHHPGYPAWKWIAPERVETHRKLDEALDVRFLHNAPLFAFSTDPFHEGLQLLVVQRNHLFEEDLPKMNHHAPDESLGLLRGQRVHVLGTDLEHPFLSNPSHICRTSACRA